METASNFLNSSDSEDREEKLRLGDNFLDKGIKPSDKELFDYEDCYGNGYNQRIITALTEDDYMNLRFKYVTADEREKLYNEVWSDPVIKVANKV